MRIIPSPMVGQVWADARGEFRVMKVNSENAALAEVKVRRADGHEQALRGHEWNALARRSRLVSEPDGRTRGTSKQVMESEGARRVTP